MRSYLSLGKAEEIDDHIDLERENEGHDLLDELDNNLNKTLQHFADKRENARQQLGDQFNDLSHKGKDSILGNETEDSFEELEDKLVVTLDQLGHWDSDRYTHLDHGGDDVGNTIDVQNIASENVFQDLIDREASKPLDIFNGDLEDGHNLSEEGLHNIHGNLGLDFFCVMYVSVTDGK